MQGPFNIGPVYFLYPATGHELDTRNSNTWGPKRWVGIYPGEYDIHFRTFAYLTLCLIQPSSSPTDTIALHVRSTLHLGEPTNGSLDGGVQLQNNLGYYHFYSTDLPGSLDAVGGEEGVIKLIRDVGLVWAVAHPEVNFGVGDISLPGGGSYQPDHTSHQNGRDMDVRYVRTDNGDGESTGRLDLSDPAQREYYDKARTLDLLRTFAAAGCITKIYVDPRAEITGADLPGVEVIVDSSGIHANHFHIQICDPDGDDSNVCRG